MGDVLLESALGLIREEGPAALTVRRITERAGCSTTGVYTHFGSKQGLVEEIYIDGFDSFDCAVSKLLANDDLLGAGRAYRQWALSNQTHYLVMFGRAIVDFTPTPSAAARSLRSFKELIDAVERCGGGEDAVQIAYRFYATMHGYVMLELVNLGPVGTEALDALYEDGISSVIRSW